MKPTLPSHHRDAPRDKKTKNKKNSTKTNEKTEEHLKCRQVYFTDGMQKKVKS